MSHLWNVDSQRRASEDHAPSIDLMSKPHIEIKIWDLRAISLDLATGSEVEQSILLVRRTLPPPKGPNRLSFLQSMTFARAMSERTAPGRLRQRCLHSRGRA